MTKTGKTRPLAEIINELSARMKLIASRRPYSEAAQVELLQAMQASTWKAESMQEHWLALDRLACQLISNQYFADAAVIAGCTLELIKSVRPLALEDAGLPILRCHLLAKYAHAASCVGKFVESTNADSELAVELMAVLRSGSDFPVKLPGLTALVDHLIKETCAPAMPKLIGFVERRHEETV